MVNKVNMGLWADGLLSGEFEQNIGTLVRIRVDGTRSYCCLGVACEIAIRHGVELKFNITTIPDGHVYADYGGRSDALPEPVIEWLGLDTDDPILDKNRTNAIQANDSLKWNFREIANALKAMYELEVADDGQDDT